MEDNDILFVAVAAYADKSTPADILQIMMKDNNKLNTFFIVFAILSDRK